MHALTRLSLLQTAILLLSACASAPRIQSGYDPGVDFSRFSTYNFSSPVAIDDPNLTELVTLYYSAAVEQQMQGMGYTRSDDPDLLIDVSADLEDKSQPPKLAKMTTGFGRRASTSCPDSGDYDGQVARAFSSTGSVSTLCRFKQGSIKIEMTAMKPERQVWSGSLLVRVAENERSAYLQQNIVNDTAQLFADSPFERPSS